MPSRNVIKQYTENGHYHIYNRGVNKGLIFADDQDYRVFLSYLKSYLNPPPPKHLLPTKHIYVKGRTFDATTYQVKNYSKEIKLLCYCLMPNHFHFLIKQQPQNGIQEFMRSLSTRYAYYFNKRHQRTGPLFQSRYKAVLIDSEEYLLHLSRYIHLNPSEFTSSLSNWYSSYSDYLGTKKTPWVKPKLILSFFSETQTLAPHTPTSYQQFVESKQDSLSKLGTLIIETLD